MVLAQSKSSIYISHYNSYYWQLDKEEDQVRLRENGYLWLVGAIYWDRDKEHGTEARSVEEEALFCSFAFILRYCVTNEQRSGMDIDNKWTCQIRTKFSVYYRFFPWFSYGFPVSSPKTLNSMYFRISIWTILYIIMAHSRHSANICSKNNCFHMVLSSLHKGIVRVDEWMDTQINRKRDSQIEILT